MKTKTSFLFILVLLVVSCSKDKFTTEPQVKIKSIKPTTVVSGNIIQLLGSYTDQEGDLDSIYLVYKWYNGTTAVRHDTIRYAASYFNLPSGTRKADIDVTFEYNTNNNQNLMPLPGVSIRDTTASFGLVLLDKAKHRSNYAESNSIRLKKP